MIARLFSMGLYGLEAFTVEVEAGYLPKAFPALTLWGCRIPPCENLGKGFELPPKIAVMTTLSPGLP